MLLMIEQAKRDEVNQRSNLYAITNNKYTQFSKKTERPPLCIFLCEQLVRWGDGTTLPYGDFKWVLNVDDNFDFNIPDGSPIGFFLEVDLYYPPEIHDKYNNLPFCPKQPKHQGQLRRSS